MSYRCPNCGSGKTDRENVLERWCAECGTLFYGDGSEINVPTRSRPAEVLELPDENGWWYDIDNDRYIRVEMRGGTPCYANSGDPVETGKWWVRCVPPIIAPAKPEPDPDAEWLRTYASNAKGELNMCRMLSIADDLERLKREAKEGA